MKIKNLIRIVLILLVVFCVAGIVFYTAKNRSGFEIFSFGNEQTLQSSQDWKTSVPEEQGVMTAELIKVVENISIQHRYLPP